jgi:hypothetical protein
MEEWLAIRAANVLNSPRAVEMGIYVVRAVQLRELLSSNNDLPPAPKRRGIGFTADLEKP